MTTRSISKIEDRDNEFVAKIINETYDVNRNFEAHALRSVYEAKRSKQCCNENLHPINENDTTRVSIQ